MISRKSTRYLARLYRLLHPAPVGHPVYEEGEFCLEHLKQNLYDEEYEPWFLKLIDRHFESGGEIEGFILGLHTGDSFADVIESEEEALRRGQEYLLRLTKSILSVVVILGGHARNDFDPFDMGLRHQSAAFLSQLELDGYVVRNDDLYEVETSVINVQAEQGYLASLIDSFGLTDSATIKHHLQLAEEHYVGGRYSDSIGNSRHFLEAILSQVLEQVITNIGSTLHPNVYKNATATRDHLERVGLISTAEKETLKHIYGLLSNTGGHAYIAQKDQARLMWHLALTCSQFALLRYEGFIKARP